MVDPPSDSSTSTHSRFWQRIFPGLGFVVCGLAIAVVVRQFQDTDWRLVWQDLDRFSGWQLSQAFGLVLCSYGAIACYDILAFRYIKQSLAVYKIAFAGFITYAISPNVGFAFLSGSVLRYRLYRPWNIQTIDIAKVIAFTNMNLWIGLIPISGFVFATTQFPLPQAIAHFFTIFSPQHFGIFLLGLSIIYLLFLWRCQDIKQRQKYHLELPSLSLTIQQIIVFACDWGFAAWALHFLLGHPYSYIAFFGIYVIAMVAGLVSTVPGGFGIFETVIIFFLEPLANQENILATLIVFRILYYFLPFVIAVAALLMFELRQRFS